MLKYLYEIQSHFGAFKYYFVCPELVEGCERVKKNQKKVRILRQAQDERFKLFVVFLLFQFNISLAQLVDITHAIPGIKVDCVYATTRNFTGKKIYKKPVCYLLKEVALNLNKVQQDLEKQGLGLLVWDAYRPFPAQKRLYDAAPDKKYIADPKMGGRHTRGTTVDLTIIRRSDGSQLDMGTGHDDFTTKAHYASDEISKEARNNRKLLHDLMLKHGFEQLPHEWWHYDFKGWRNYPVLDIEFDLIS